MKAISFEDPAIRSIVEQKWLDFNERMIDSQNDKIDTLNAAVIKQDEKIDTIVSAVHDVHLITVEMSGKVDVMESKILPRDEISEMIDVKTGIAIGKINNLNETTNFKIKEQVHKNIKIHEKEKHTSVSKDSSSSIRVNIKDWKQIIKIILSIITLLTVGTGVKFYYDDDDGNDKIVIREKDNDVKKQNIKSKKI